MTEAPSAITYASVVSKESIRIKLLIAALNNLEVFAADFQNAYLKSPCKEKIYTILGEYFGPHSKREVSDRSAGTVWPYISAFIR
jgi:hypothetical protein